MGSATVKSIAVQWQGFKQRKELLPARLTEVIALDHADQEVGLRAIFISGPCVARGDGVFEVSPLSKDFLDHLEIRFRQLER